MTVAAVAEPAPPLALTRVNADSAWRIELDGTTILLDPWLGDPAVLVTPGLHVAELDGPVAPLGDVLPADALVISHPFPDHCHGPSLRRLPRDLPVFTPLVVRPWVARLGWFRAVRTIRNRTLGGPPTIVGDVELWWCRATAPLDTTHNALILRGRTSGTTVMYCPHALLLGGRTLATVEAVLGGRLDVLLCSFVTLDLPGYLGGVANLGEAHALGLVERLRPRFVAPTHDGIKPDRGFIARVARLTRPEGLAAALAGREVGSVAIEAGVGERWVGV